MRSLSSHSASGVQVARSPRNWLGMIIALPVVVIIAFSLWVAVSAVQENLRFGKATDQLIGVIALVRDYATRQVNFAVQPGEDLLGELVRFGQIEASKNGPADALINPWMGNVTVYVSAPPMMRVETEVPARDCRRLALLFAKEAGDLGLQVLEAKDKNRGIYRRFFDITHGENLSNPVVEAACGSGDHEILALVLKVR